VRSAHTRKLGAHKKCAFKKNDFAQTSYTTFQIDASPGKMLHKRNGMRTQSLQKRSATGNAMKNEENGSERRDNNFKLN